MIYRFWRQSCGSIIPGLALLALSWFGAHSALACDTPACCTTVQTQLRLEMPGKDNERWRCGWVRPTDKRAGNACACGLFIYENGRAIGTSGSKCVKGPGLDFVGFDNNCQDKHVAPPPTDWAKYCATTKRKYYWSWDKVNPCHECPPGKTKHCGKCICPDKRGFEAIGKGDASGCNCADKGLKVHWTKYGGVCADPKATAAEAAEQAKLAMSAELEDECRKEASCGSPNCDKAGTAPDAGGAKKASSAKDDDPYAEFDDPKPKGPVVPPK